MRSVNTFEIWNVRPMPSAVRRFSASAEMSSPNSSTRPEVGCSVPAMQLNSVVLPAPFGPISTRRSPRATRERNVVDGAQAAEHLREPVDLDRGRLMRPPRDRRRASAPTSPMMPCGAHSTVTMNTMPSTAV